MRILGNIIIFSLAVYGGWTLLEKFQKGELRLPKMGPNPEGGAEVSEVPSPPSLTKEEADAIAQQIYEKKRAIPRTRFGPGGLKKAQMEIRSLIDSLSQAGYQYKVGKFSRKENGVITGSITKGVAVKKP